MTPQLTIAEPPGRRVTKRVALLVWILVGMSWPLAAAAESRHSKRVAPSFPIRAESPAPLGYDRIITGASRNARIAGAGYRIGTQAGLLTSALTNRQSARPYLAQSSLPTSAFARFREPAFWQLYRDRISLVLVLILAQALLIAFLLFERRQRQRAAKELRESEERYRDLLENANDIIFTHDLSGKFTSLNRMGEKVTGYTRAELLGMNVSQLIAPEYTDLVHRMAERDPSSRKANRYELEIFAKDGNRVALEVTTRLLFKSDRPVGVHAIARDITNRRRAEAQLNLLQTIAVEMAATTSLSSALEVMLRRVCQKTGWVFGQAWLPRKDTGLLA